MYNPSLTFHFTGIGGSGMSGIAEVLLSLGFRVSGSDLADSATVRRLRSLGAVVSIGHEGSNLAPDVSLLVFSSAIAPGNPEVVEAHRRGIPVVPRGEVLGELMRLKFGIAVAGSHGKTTTTSMIATVLEGGGLDPTVVVGGCVRGMASGGKLGRGPFLVAESDESDRSFLGLRPTIAIVTNIDGEHLSAYESLEELAACFGRFAASVPFYGLAVLCADDPAVRRLAAFYPRRRVRYGLGPDADIRATSIRYEGGRTRYEVWRGADRLFATSLPVPGEHMVVNSLAAVAVGLELALPPKVIGEALEGYRGVSRRLETIGEGKGLTIVNDYGHHPAEIRATLKALRSGGGGAGGRLHVVFQPHRYSRTRDCLHDFVTAFGEADTLAVTEIYAAGEEPLPGVSGSKLLETIDHPAKTFLPTPHDAAGYLAPIIGTGDMIVFLGAGSVGAAAWSFAHAHGIALVDRGESPASDLATPPRL